MVLKEHPQIFVLCDDVYSDLCFSKFTHLLEVAPELKKRVVIISSVSKKYAMTGWRIGWAVCENSELISSINRYQSQSISCTTHVAQVAASKALLEGELFIKKSLQKLKDKKDFAVKQLQKLGLDVIEPEGTFYIWVPIQPYLKGNLKTSRDFSKALLEEKKVTAVSGLDFGLDGYLRISHCLSFEDIERGLTRLGQFIQSL